MNRVLLTGATGFIGRSLAVKIQENNANLITAVRRRSDGIPDTILQIEVGDILSDIDWSNTLDNVSTVIHTVARVHVMDDDATDQLSEYRRVNVDGTMNLARQAISAGVGRFIFLSSIKVNGETTKTGKPFTADDSPAPMDAYGVSKAEAEQALLDLSSEAQMDVVIIRPVLVYGPEVKANFLSMMRWLNRGVPLPFGSIHNKRSLVALDNLVDLIITCIEHPAAANQIFLVSDGDDLSTTELLQRVSKALGRPARLLPVPAWIISLAATLFGKRDVSQRLLDSLQVDISKTRDLLGWVPPVSVDEALQKTAQSFLLKK